MSNILQRLNCRVELYGQVREIKNEIGEKDFEYGKIKDLWAEITPQGGSQVKGQGNTISAEISHKLVIRNNAIKGLVNDMYFMFKGQRYDIKYFNPNYKYKDSIEILFISSVNTYFKQLAGDYILDNNYNNHSDVDVEAQRLAWEGIGKTEASGWDAQTIKNNAFKRTMFLKGDIKILDAMENLKFTVSLF